MKSISEVNLYEILPESIKRDEKVTAIAKALTAELQKLSLQTRLPLHLPRIDELDHSVLDKLAEGYHVDFYEPESMTLEIKRALIKEAIHEHQKYGTKYAVEKLLNTLSRGAKISEWWNYGGKPYHFKANLKGLQDLDDDGERIIRAIEITKSLRDTIDDFDFDLTVPGVDEILHFGILQLFLGNLFFDLCNVIKTKHGLKFWQYEITFGNLFYTGDFSNSIAALNLRAGFINFTHGKIKYDCEIELSDETWYSLFLQWIRSRLRNFDAAIIRFYTAESDEPLDEPVIEEFEGQFIKLWMDYHNDDGTRLLVMNFARDDLTASDINAVNVDGLFINRRGNLSNKIIRSVYVNKKITRLLDR